MAARWGTGEEMLKACNTQMFSPVNLDEAEILQGSFTSSCLEYTGLNNGDALEALHSCLDPSILSIFEENPTGEVKCSIDEESEATLLTALTEILDNVDDENLSPFDTLPDSDMFSGQKGQEHSPLRKLLTRSSPETLMHARQFPGKSLPRMQRASQQNSEGEEEEDGDANFFTQITNIDLSSLEELMEQDGESMPVTLNDLVKHMHPYCMTLCVEGEEGQEHLLPDRGLVLEVVDQGENGEPILAIPDLGILFSHADFAEGEQRVPEKSVKESETKPKDSAEKFPQSSEVSLVGEEKRAGKLCKGKKKCRPVKADLVEKRILRSSRVKKEPQKKPQEEPKKKKVTFSPVLLLPEPEKPKICHPTELMTPETLVEKEHIMSPQSEAKIIESQPENNALDESVEEEPPSKQEPVSEQPTVCQRNETKPKPLSLQQYRLLRQQKKPDPVDKTEDYSTKWPKLPETPKELPPIPCLPDPNLRDPRKTFHTPVKKDLVPEIMPAWHPRGPAAPPTPEALLTPPASLMVSSKKPASSKVSGPPPSGTSSESLPCSVHLSSQKLPAPISVPQNTIHTETSSPIRQLAEVPPERMVSPPVSTTSGDSCGLNAPRNKECLHGNPSAARVCEGVPSKDPSRPQMITTLVQGANSSPLKPSDALPAKRETEQVVLAPVSDQAKNTLPTHSKKLTSRLQPHVAPIAAQPFFSAQVQARVVELAEQMRMASSEVPKPKNTTAELIESFTNEIGIEAADLSSLLEQFEESQSKEEPRVPEVCGRAAAVGNSSYEQQVETKALEKTRHDLGSTAGLTPPATPPHQMWKPIAPVSLLGKTKKSEVLKPSPNKAIQIEARPLPSNKLRSKPQTSTTTGQTQPFSLDHDYCLPPKEPNQSEFGSRWNVKQQPSIVIKTVDMSFVKPVQNSVCQAASTPSVTEGTQRNLSQPSADTCCTLNGSTLETPDASPKRPVPESSLPDDAKCNQQKSMDYSECSSRQYQQERGRTKRRYRTRSSSSSESSSESSSSSSSRSRSPPRKRYRSPRSSSRSSSSSRSCSRSSSRSFSPPRRRRCSYSSSRSGSWSRSLSRSRSRSSESHGHQRWKSHRSPNRRSGYHYSQNCSEDTKIRKEKAIEERRVVYVGRIHGSMTRKELKERFSFFGKIEECTVHFRENRDNYGFVTYYNTKDAFNAIENGSKLREQNELPFDLCFGGRRQFCRSSYADLDSNREYEPRPTKCKFDVLDFDTLLKQAQRNLKR